MVVLRKVYQTPAETLSQISAWCDTENLSLFQKFQRNKCSYYQFWSVYYTIELVACDAIAEGRAGEEVKCKQQFLKIIL